MLNRVKGSYFAKLVFSHLTLTLVLVIVIGGLLLGKTERMMSEEMRQSGEARVTSVRQKLEKDLLESYRSALLNRALNTVRPEADSEILFFLENGRGDSYYRLARFTQDLKTLSFTLPLLHNVTFYFMKDDLLLSQYYHATPQTSPQAELLRDKEKIVPHKWQVRKVSNYDRSVSDETLVLTYIHTLPFLAKGDRIKGYMIVDLDASKVIADASQRLGHQDNLVIFGKDGEQVGISGSIEPDVLEWVRGELTQPEKVSLAREHEAVTITAAGDSIFGWRYALIRPQYSSLLLTQQMRQEIWVFGAALLLLGLIVSVVASRRVYGTFADFVQRIRNVTGLGKTAASHNEMGFVEHALGLLDQQKRAYMLERKEKQWRALLSGISEPLDGEALLQDASGYIPVYIEFSDKDIERLYGWLQEDSEFESLRGDWVTLTPRSAYWILMPKDGLEDPSPAAIRRLLEGALLRGDMTGRFRAGVGTRAAKLEDLSMSAVEAQTASRYGFLHRDSAVLRYEDVQNLPNVYPDIQLSTFELLLRSGSAEELEQYLSACERKLSDGGTTIEMVELMLTQLRISLSKMRMLQDEAEKEHAPEPMRYTLSETFEDLRAQSLQMVANRSEKRNERNERVLAEIQAYIRANIHDDISLDQLTELTSYSKQFICKLFKDELQMTFVDYITNERLARAAELLKSTEEPIGRIAERTGFRSSQYFSTRFKSRYGITPVQYRLSYR